MTNTYTYENLEVGQVYKSYRQLCEALGANVEGGNSKKSQFREWDCHFSYRKQGNKFIIEEIYDTPLELVETRGGANHSIYGELIQLLILGLLYRNDGFVSLTRNKIFEELGMVNVNYRQCKTHVTKLANYLHISPDLVLDFYNINDNNFKKSVIKALDTLMDKRVVMYNTIIKVKEQGQYVYRDATQEELAIIGLIENKMLEKMEYRSVSEVRGSGDWHEFKSNTMLHIKGLTNIDYYFTAYDIYSSNENVEKEQSKLIEEISTHENYDNHRLKLNNLIIENIDYNASKRQEKAKYELESSNGAVKDIIYLRANDDYTKNFNSVADELINLNKGSIMNSITTHKEDLTIAQKNEIDELYD